LKDVFSVEGKVTIVTGGGTGIGAVIAREFALRGAPVLVASRNAGHLEPVRDAIRKAGGKCEMAVCDVRNAESCDALVAEAVKHFGRLDVMINNHGASIASPSLKLSPNGWRAVVSINLDGVFFCSKAAARQFVEQNAALCGVQGRRDQAHRVAGGGVGPSGHPRQLHRARTGHHRGRRRTHLA
jgi:NAD(P)-dependent dehydrogenase (short-subunit alcohol dehydrogenase family)